jgi:alcohol dehydrogenase (cytochrome c)
VKKFTFLLVLLNLAASALGQVTYQHLLEADREPGNWLTYSGSYNSQRHSRLEQINRDNVSELEMKWAFQMRTLEDVETSPLVVDGIMYLTEPPSNAHAVDTRTGRTFWSYTRELPDETHTCCGQVNRGLAMLGEKLYLGTVDAYLVALDSKTGSVLWEVEVADRLAGYSITVAPLVVKDKVIVGVSGGEFGIRGFLDAYDAETGKRVWRFYTVPAPGEPGHDTWEGDDWKTGGAPTWITGSFDPALNLIYWGTGNPSPDFNGELRPGDNLYSDCVIALDADTGQLKWYFQFTPHDVWDWDAAQIPVLVDAEFEGRMRKLMLWPNRNAFYYVLDRETGELLLVKQFARQTWAQGMDSKGRPIIRLEALPTEKGVVIWPGIQGAMNWYSPSYSPLTGLLYLNQRCGL